MLSEMFIAGILLTCMACFFAVNLHNILRKRKKEEDTQPHAEVEQPSSVILTITGFGTLTYFIETIVYIILIFANLISSPILSSFLHYDFSFTFYTQAAGIIFTLAGYALFIWSVIARGRYATSWEMQNTHKLVTWGPYRFVRHPSYLAYSLLFTGLLAMWPNFLTIVPLVAIPSYVKATDKEEKLLEAHFGNECKEYQRKTGRFFPRLSKKSDLT
jgi:protein-S-isoprenylcysteine O-methyltransferase Ste14